MKKYIFALLLSIYSSSILAHPHSFLDMKNKVLFEQDKLEGFQMTWTLDEITSAELIYELNSSKDKAKALEKITGELNQSAIEAHYFSELYNKDNQPIKFKSQPFNPSVEVKDERIIYHFVLKLAEPQAVKGQSFRFYTFEPSYYLSMEYDNPQDLSWTEQEFCKIKLEAPSASQSLRLYASQLDKNAVPDIPEDSALSLGAQFAQKVSIVCQ